MATYRVTAPYILLEVTDQAGKRQVNGFYEGAIVANPVDEDKLKKAVTRKWVDLVDEPAAVPAPDPTPAPAPGPEVTQAPGPSKPGQADQKAAWVDYAVAQGIERDQAEAMTKADLIELLK